MNPKKKLQKETNTPAVDPKSYQSLIGGLLCFTTIRWDIQYTIGCLSRYMQNSQIAHMVAAKNVLRYLKRSQDLGIFYLANNNEGLLTYADADWAGNTDSSKSTSGSL